MRPLKHHLNQLTKVKRKLFHPLVHTIHKTHKIARNTLFYIKEYGPKSNISHTIIKESIKILLFASILSSIGGLSLENIKSTFISIIPLVILLPTLNNLIGDYGIIFSSKFTTLLYEGKISKKSWLNKELRYLLFDLIVIAIITAVLSSLLAIAISHFAGYSITPDLIEKVMLISLIDVIALVLILFFIGVAAGFYFYDKQEDPNNFLIPITTSIADLGNMLLLTLLIILFF